MRSLIALLGALPLLFLTPTLAQQTAELAFYYNWVAQFDCNGLPLSYETITAGECVDVATISVGDKHWQALSGLNVPTGCSGVYSFRLSSASLVRPLLGRHHGRQQILPAC
jgi:hypothetical protein